ncbi:MAG: outer membrane beta-barrel protein [Candidatus Cloacimonetes bacterium]|nr:outer membrane beta-barrel protein [Candidatus Cloacimonadota bacterium]
MKKTIFFLIAIVIIANLFCQEAKTERLTGFKGGVNRTRIIGGKDVKDTDNRTGYFFGLYTLEQLSENSVLGIDMLFSAKGGKIKAYHGAAITELRYFELPIHFKHIIRTTHNDAEVQPFVGMTPAILLKGISDYDKERKDITKDLESFDFGFNIGVDIVFQKRLILGVTYTKGVTNIMKSTDYSATNSTVSFNLNTVFF